MKQLLRGLAVQVRVRTLCRLAEIHHRRLRSVAVIGVTGSCGKTTTKDLVATVLSARYEGVKSPGSRNRPKAIAQALLRAKPGHGFCVLELGAEGPGSLEHPVRLARARIGVVTSVLSDHCQVFGSLEATAAEKSRLIAALPPDGVAVLNADDPRVLAMRSLCAGRVLTFGLAPDATVRARDVRGAWPERLELTVAGEEAALPLRTRLCGTHWVGSVLAALAVGVAMGVPLEEGVRALEGVEPSPRRLSPLEIDGVTYLRDDFKSALSSFPAALEVLRAARANRKIAVIGTIRQYAGPPEPVYAMVARQALEVADHVVFVGPNASLAAAAAAPTARSDSLRALETIQEAKRYLRELVRPGDLVLVKGHHHEDRLERLLPDAAQGAAALA